MKDDSEKLEEGDIIDIYDEDGNLLEKGAKVHYTKGFNVSNEIIINEKLRKLKNEAN